MTRCQNLIHQIEKERKIRILLFTLEFSFPNVELEIKSCFLTVRFQTNKQTKKKTVNKPCIKIPLKFPCTNISCHCQKRSKNISQFFFKKQALFFFFLSSSPIPWSLELRNKRQCLHHAFLCTLPQLQLG